MGLSFSFSSILAGIIFGGIGFVAFMYGKKRSMPKKMIIGALLSVYPYFFSNVWIIWGVGTLLTASLWVIKD